MTSTVVQVHDVPTSIRSLGEPHDYVDLFVATVPGAMAASPEEWARATMEGASAVGRFMAWRMVCGLQLHSDPSPDHIAGWRIADRGHDWIRVVARSWFMSAQIVFQIDKESLSFATFVRYDRRIAAAIWGSASNVHRAVAPDFLASGVRRLQPNKGVAA